MVETEYEAIGFIYQGQIDVLLKSGPQSSFFLLNNPLELSYGHVSVAIRIQGVLGSVVEVALFRAGSRNTHLSWYMAYPTQGTKFDLGRVGDPPPSHGTPANLAQLSMSYPTPQ